MLHTTVTDPSDYSGANIHRVIPTGMTKATISVPRNTAPSGTSADFKATLTLNGGCVNATVGVETAVVNVCNRTGEYGVIGGVSHINAVCVPCVGHVRISSECSWMHNCTLQHFSKEEVDFKLL